MFTAGRFVFERLGARLHRRPATVARLAAQEPAALMVFDVLYLDGERLMGRPYRERRDSREAVVGAITGTPHRPETALLGRWDADGRPRYLGRTAPLTAGQARDLAAELTPASPGHPWEDQRFSASWGSQDPLIVVFVEPGVVGEVSVDVSRVAGGGWRHSVRWIRLRPDLTPADLPLHSEEA